MFQILVVDDDKNIRRYLCTVLTQAGYHALPAASAEAALQVLETSGVDFIILDVMMPEMDGYHFTRLLRDCQNNLPIMMLSAKELPEDIKKGFLAGTDDYMTKPVDEEEMLLRIKALLRRAKIVADRRLIVGSTILDYDTLTVKDETKEQILPQKEFYILYKLLSYPNQIFTRIQLMDEIWGPASESADATVSVHINRLRKRFENCQDFSIVTIRGLGYRAYIREEKI